MKLLLLPISTRRSLIYCQRLNVTASQKQGWIDWGTTKAANLWTSWEKKESGWQRKVVDYGNGALKRIPYEEWGLKSIPPLSARRMEEEKSGKGNVEVSFPKTLIPEETVTDLLKKLGTERQQLHQSRMIWCFVGMPIVAPFALVPVIPNLPFFYLVFRAWSHWKALGGSKHLQFLVDNKLVALTPSNILDELYSSGKRPFDIPSTSNEGKIDPTSMEETMVLHKSDGKRIAEALEIPELNIELDRAVWQVERDLKAKKELKEEKKELDSVNSKSQVKK